jgi:hypothetical protein
VDAFPAAGSVLVVAPHPDDETLGCGGAITLHLRAGDAVRVLVLTDGGRSRAATSAVRAGEARAAAAVLGGVWDLCGLPESDWQDEEAQALLTTALASARPSVIYAPSSLDYHPEHIRVSRLLACVLQRLDRGPTVRVYEVGVPLTRALASHALRLEADAARAKALALRSYVSQRYTIAAVRRLHRYNRALYGIAGDVEVFREVSAPAYVALIRDAGAAPGRVRGVRQRPVSDPLCYLRGTSLRRSLRGAPRMPAAR